MRRFFILAAAATMLLLASCSQQPMTPEAASPGDELRPTANPTEPFISEYIEGSSNNKALEIYNGTGGSVDLGAGGYNVFMSFNGGTSTLTINLTGTVANGDVYVVAQSSADATILAQADQTNGAGWYNGDDAVVLRKGTTVIDAFGQIGFDPGTEWGTGLVSTADNTLRRKADVCAGDADGSNAFDPAIEWDGYATNTFDGLGAHAASCGAVVDLPPTLDSSTPANGSFIASGDTNIGVTFSEPVTVSTSAFVLSCTTAGSVDTVVSGGGSTYSIDPVVDLPERDSCELTVQATEVTDLDGAPDTMTDDTVVSFDVGYQLCGTWVLPTYAIQSSGSAAAITGSVVTGGVVIGDYEGPSPTLRGFFLQDSAGDADPATSDGIFVFNGSSDSVNLGDLVVVTGTAADFQDQTQVSSSTVTVCDTGVSVTPVDVTLPVPSADYLERYEGMLVRFPQTLYVTEMFQLGRFGQVVMSSGDRLPQPTSVALPGAGALAVQAENDLNRVIVDDDLNNQNPDPILFGRGGAPLSASNTLRGGDTATGMVGVLTYTWAGNSASGNAYRLRPVNALGGSVTFEPTNERPTTVPDVGGSLKVGGFNLLNYFDTFDGLPDTIDNCTNGVGGAPTDCRGADTASEFDRQWPKTVAAILGMDVDVLAVTELENDGYGPSSAIADLTDRLNAATAPGTWAFVDADTATGEVNALGLDAIKVGILYRPSAVTPLGQTAALNSEAFVNGGDADLRNRPALAQAFADDATGATFIAVANHLKSKGSACEAPDAGDGQGNCNAVRVNAVQELVAWLGTDPTGTGDPDVLLLGDYNSYAMEDPIQELLSEGFVDLQRAYGGTYAYTYVFDGQWGSLDQALASPSLEGQVTGTAAWHVNADEPSVLDYNTDFKTANLIASLYAPDAYRTSDHDPLVVGLDLGGPNCVAATPSRTNLWPVNHKFVPVSIDVPHSDGSSVTVMIDSIFQDELVDAPGKLDGSTSPDASGIGEAVAQVRAERYEGGNGRVYHVAFTAQDALGQTCSGTVLVNVPTSLGRNGAAIDDGPLYDSTTE